MGQRHTELSDRHIEFIAQQKLFFVGTATADSRVNVSPKGMDTFRVFDSSRVAWLNLTGSGNETAAHVQHGEHTCATCIPSLEDQGCKVIKVVPKPLRVRNDIGEFLTVTYFLSCNRP